jgi:mRNA interferase MazF
MPPIAVIIPFTSNIQALRFPYTKEVKPTKTSGLNVVSIALVFQIRAIDIKRIKKKIGEIEDSIMMKIDYILNKFIYLH